MRAWLMTLTAAALVAALANALTPAGFPKKLTKFASGLVLLLAMLTPLERWRGQDVSAVLEQYQARYETAYTQVRGTERETLVKSIIERETAAYISDKATALGIEECHVTVLCQMTDEGFPAPQQVTVRGAGDAEAWQALSQTIAADFALGREAQRFERTDVP